MNTLDTTPQARERRLQLAQQILKEHGAYGGPRVQASALKDPRQRKRALAVLAGAVIREERIRKARAA